MSDADGPDDAGRDAGRDAVGSLGEEAAKLLGALSDWGREQGATGSSTVSGAAGRAQDLWHEIDQHVATGGAECRYCPVCRVIHAVRQTSPEARQHLADASLSLAKAVAGFLETAVPPAEERPGADQPGQGPARPGRQRIDLDEDGAPHEQESPDAPDDREPPR